ncbi:MAG: flagellar hook-associated protein FlgK [Rhodospirillaceae bacterium]|jgi:flagellar hook-associated protein 1 FlgK
MTGVGDITTALRSAQSGLLANQQVLNIISNNIANVNTPGYSRKNPDLISRVTGDVGSGVIVNGVSRQVDENLLRTLRIENSTLSALQTKDDFFNRTQELFGTPGANTSIAHITGEFVNAIESLAETPSGSLEHNEMVRRADDMVTKLRQMGDTIQELRQQVDRDIALAVDEINKLISSISNLNGEISSAGNLATDDTTLRDQRDNDLARLSELIDVTSFLRPNGELVVFTTGGRTLVDNIPRTLTHLPAGKLAATTTKAEGDINGIFVGAQVAGNDITSEIRDGEMKGLIELRDNILTDMQSQLDEFAAEVRDVYNAIHNRGAPQPGMQTATGTRRFVDSSTQTITFGGTDDTKIVIMDSNGDQTASLSLRTSLGGAGPFTIDAVATAIQTFLQANDGGLGTSTAAVSSSGTLNINLTNTSLKFVIRDESATANGSSVKDAVINFDSGGVVGTDETINGFSNFFGLNDFFVDTLTDGTHESNVLNSGFTATAATLRFNDRNGAISVGTGTTLTIPAGTSLQGIADLINDSVSGVSGVEAGVVPDGSGFRLRITHNQGIDLVITQDTTVPDTLLGDLGLHVADASTSQFIKVRDDILATPGLAATGAAQWDANLGTAGEYFMSPSDDTTIQQIAAAFTSTNAFDTAGGITGSTTTFTDFATSIIVDNTSKANANEIGLSFQKNLTDTLQLKSDNIKGVNLDEEMSNLILFEQAFNAAARVISVIQNMIQELNDAIR